MAAEQRDMKVPSALLPVCPVCGRPMTMNLRADDRFVEDEGWREACARYEQFLTQNRDKKVLFWELGVGMNTPSIIKYPFWQMTARNPKARYVCVNRDLAYAPEPIAGRSLCLAEDLNLLCDLAD